jgi:hypothetical protein
MAKRILGVLAALLLALTLTPAVAQAAGNSGGGSGSSAAALAPEVKATGEITPAQTCAAGDLCFWVHINYGGARGRVAGNNTNWGVFSQSQCANGTWSNCASSIINNGTQCTAYQYDGTSYGGDWMYLLRGANNPDLRTTISAGNWNDRISSNRWCSPA